MKTFTQVAAQGEITIRRIGDVPAKRCVAGYTAMKPDNGRFIVGHSETGHHHVIDAAGASVDVLDRPPEGMRILRAILDKPAALEHLRGHDTHEPVMLQPGEYEFRIAREFDHYGELARQSAD
jgi:hypothetical protein